MTMPRPAITDANDKDFQVYARSIHYGNPYTDPRFEPNSDEFDPQLDNEAALVAMNDGCYHNHAAPGCFTRPEAVPHPPYDKSGNYKTGGFDWMFWVPLIGVIVYLLLTYK